MCGISGIISTEHNPKDLIHLLTSRMKHRGPDYTGCWTEDNIALGHNRLSIIDLDSRSNQPMISGCGKYAMVFNGEIYNFKEVRNTLQFSAWKTTSDSEVLLQGYIEKGAKILNDLNGMFAFAIYHLSERKLFIARDRLGIKPLYYVNKNGNFAFSSELRPLLQLPFVSSGINNSAVVDYLTFQSTVSPNTLVKDVQVLPSGCYVHYSNTSFETHQFWGISDGPKYHFENFSEAQDEIRRLFTSSVRYRLVSDVSIGAFLSGGIDSSLIVAQMAKISESPIVTKSIGFKESQYDETAIATIVADRYATEHERIELSAIEFAESIPMVMSQMDSPSMDGVNTYFVSQAVKNSGITVALSGLGGDELFAGYQYHFHYSKLRKLRSWLKWLSLFDNKSFIDILQKPKHRKLAISLFTNTSNSRLYQSLRSVFDKYQRSELIQSVSRTSHTKIDDFPVLSQYGIMDILGYTQNVLLKDTDQMSMQHALEVRVPFFDHRLVEAALSIPDKWKYDGTRPKSFLTTVFKDDLPKEVYERQKMGFVLPYNRWLRYELKTYAQTKLKHLASTEILNPDRVNQISNSFFSGSPKVSASEIWTLVALSSWLESNHIQ